MKKFIIIALLFVGFASLKAQDLGKLSVDKIMRDPVWMGVSPSNIQWSEDSKTVYFQWNPDGAKKD